MSPPSAGLAVEGDALPDARSGARPDAHPGAPAHRRDPRIGRRLVLVAALAASLPGLAALAALALGLPAGGVVLAALALGLPLGSLVGLAFVGRMRRHLHALRDGVQAFQEGEYGLRLPSDRGDEVGDVYRLVNRVGEVLRTERIALHQKEWMLESLLQSTPMAVLLANDRRRVVYSNRAARRLLSDGARLEGRSLDEVVGHAPPGLAAQVREGGDALVPLELEGQEESFHLSQRVFRLHGRPHTLLTLRRMTPELRRQEVAVWKKVIRVMSHELNNSLAPIASLARSARLVARDPERVHRLEDVFETIEDRARHLQEFLEGYARFARLPAPRKETVPLGPFLRSVRGLASFVLRGPLPEEPGRFDPAQVEQVLINLLRNAAEAGSPPEEIALTAKVDAGGRVSFVVRDRGRGLGEEELRAALLPFHSSKKGGAGLGLALCQEILEAHGGTLHLANRPGGGVRVTCRLPGKGSSLGATG